MWQQPHFNERSSLPARDEGLVLQQLLYADEVRSMAELDIEHTTPSAAELKLALQLIEQISEDHYQPDLFEDEDKQRILAAIDAKIEGREIVAFDHPQDRPAGEVIELTEMLKASLSRCSSKAARRKAPDKEAAVVTPLRGAAKAGPSERPRLRQRLRRQRRRAPGDKRWQLR